MKIACVLLPDFEVAVELLRHPDLAGKPVVVGGLPHEWKSVRGRSPEAAAFGVAEGTSLREAQGRCPEAVFLPADDELYARALARLLDTLDAFSPRVETVGFRVSGFGFPGTALTPTLSQGEREGIRPLKPDTRNPKPDSALSPQSSVLAFLDASGLELLFGPDEELGERIAAAVEIRTGLRAQVGIGSGKFVAQMAATVANPGAALVVKPGEEQQFLAPLPVGWIPASEEMRRRLDLFGLRTMGQLAALPRGALGEQFGREGIEASRLARGTDERPVVAREVLATLREEVEIDPPTGASYALLAEARLLAKRLEARMRSNYVACREVSLGLGFEGRGTVSLSTALQEPTDSADDLLRAVDRLLGRAYWRLSTPGDRGQGTGDGVSRRAGGNPPPSTGVETPIVLGDGGTQGPYLLQAGGETRPLQAEGTPPLPGHGPHPDPLPGGEGEMGSLPEEEGDSPAGSHASDEEDAPIDAEFTMPDSGSHPGGGGQAPALQSVDEHAQDASTAVPPASPQAGETPALPASGLPAFPTPPDSVLGPQSSVLEEDPPAVSFLALSLSGFGGLHGEQMELLPTRAASMKKVQQAVRQAEELFGEGAIRPMAQMGTGRPAASRIRVVAETDGWPRVLFLNGKREKVQEICNRWRMQEEWWRRELLREYYRLITSSGKLCLIFHDLIGGGWYVERVYG